MLPQKVHGFIMPLADGIESVMEATMTDQRIGAFTCLLTGLGVGMALATLLAPRSGSATRTLIQQKADAAKDFLTTKAEEGKTYLKSRGTDLLHEAGELVDRGKQAVQEQKDRLASAVEAGREAYRSAPVGA